MNSIAALILLAFTIFLLFSCYQDYSDEKIAGSRREGLTQTFTSATVRAISRSRNALAAANPSVTIKKKKSFQGETLPGQLSWKTLKSSRHSETQKSTSTTNPTSSPITTTNVDSSINSPPSLALNILSCNYYVPNTDEQYSCDSAEFSQLEFNQCVIDLNFELSITNTYEKNVIIDMLLDETLNGLQIKNKNGARSKQTQTPVVGKNSAITIIVGGNLNLCTVQNAEVSKTVAAFASFVSNSTSLPAAQDSFRFKIL